jgi:uncharacterized circularly permuted ATP-grasp superfamily protein
VSTSYVDEIFQADGTLRTPYARLRQRTELDPLRPTADVAERLRDRPLGDDARILPIPLVLDAAEYQRTIQAGVAQRALALQQFFADIVLGSGRILDAGTGLDAALLDAILAVESTTLTDLRGFWSSRDSNEVRFMYGPDLARAPDGRWTVLEDNVGCVGGAADCTFVTDLYSEATGVSDHLSGETEADLATAIRRWLDRIGVGREGSVAAILIEDGADPWATHVDENVRLRSILDDLGIKLRDQRTLDPDDDVDLTALVNFDSGGAVAKLFRRSRVPMFNGPGTGLLGNKAFLPFVTDFIDFYLGEEPILHTPRTRILMDGVLPDDTAGWVIKTTAGCQGAEVFVLGWQTEDRLALIEERARREWAGANAIAQHYVEHSRLTLGGPGSWYGYQLEVRLVAYAIGWGDIYVSRRPVGKAISVYDARRLNNTTRGACYVPVLLEGNDTAAHA